MDNDVLQKMTLYGLFPKILEMSPAQHETYGVLGTAKYVVGKKLKKHPPSRGLDAVLDDFNAALLNLKEFEPTSEEIRVAAYLEYQAQYLNLELDTGESLLCAVLLARQLNHILTGDKRAIRSVEALMTAHHISNSIAFKLICLEQLFFWLVNKHGANNIRVAVCSEKIVDRVLTSCFGCHSPEIITETCIDGLKSYIAALRQVAPTILARDP